MSTSTSALRIGQQLERLLVVVRGLVGSADGARLVAGPHGRGQGGDQVEGEPGMAGELGRRTRRRTAAQGLGVRRVQPYPLAGQQVVVDRLAEQGVPKGVAPLVGDQDVGLDGAPEAGVERGAVEVGRRGKHVVGDPAPGDARGPRHLAGGLVEPVEAHEQHVGQLGWDPAARSGRRPDELLDEERVALGPVDDVVDLLGTQLRRVQLGDEGADVGRLQWLELEALDAAEPGPLRDLGAERVAAVQVVGAVRRDHRYRAVERPGEQEAEHVAGRMVGPVRVLDDQQHGRLLGGLFEQPVHGLEQVGTVQRGRLVVLVGGEDPPPRLEPGQGGVDAGGGVDDVGQGGGHPAEHLGEREVGQGAVAEVEAVSGEHLPAVGVGQVAQLGEQPGLADAGVTGEQDGARFVAVGPLVRTRTDAEQGGDLRQLGVPSDQGPAGVSGHGIHHVANGGSRDHRAW